MTVKLRDVEVGTVSEVATACREAERLGVGTDELGAVWLGEFVHAPTLETECRKLLDDGSVAREAQVVARRILDALGANETKGDALRSRPPVFDSGPWRYQTEPEFPRLGSPDRDHVRAASQQRVTYWERAFEEMLVRFYERQMRVVIARLRGKQGRKGTRHWTYETKAVEPELKAIDPERVLDRTRWRNEIEEDGGALVVRLYERTARGTAETFGEALPGDVLDSPVVRDAIREKVRYLMASTDARAEQVMAVILDADASGADLDAIVDRVIGTYEQRQIWARTPAELLAAGAVNDAAVKAALALGATLKQWISSRDDKVRWSHRASGGGDGQVVPIAAPFLIGGFPLQVPGDPSGLPASGPHVYGCRCSVLLARPGGGEPTRFVPLAELPGATPPAWDTLDAGVAASLVQPRFGPDAIDAQLAAWLGFAVGLDPATEFRRRGWRAALVRTLEVLVAAWLAAQAVQAAAELVELAAQIPQTLAEAGVPSETLETVRDRLQADLTAAQRTIEADEEATA